MRYYGAFHPSALYPLAQENQLLPGPVAQGKVPQTAGQLGHNHAEVVHRRQESARLLRTLGLGYRAWSRVVTPERQEPYDGRLSRTVLWEPGDHGPRATRLRQGTTVTERYEVINCEEGSYPISSMCRWSGVSKSGYYSWRDRPQSQTAIRREELAILIKDVFEHSDGTYGYRRIQVVLERRGVRAGGSTIRAIMRGLGLQAAQPRAKVRTTVPAKDLDERPDLLRRDSRR